MKPLGGAMDEVIGIIGQAVLLLTLLGVVVYVVFLILWAAKRIRQLWRELRPSQSELPPTDAVLPPRWK
jgi:hypothetical protein